MNGEGRSALKLEAEEAGEDVVKWIPPSNRPFSSSSVMALRAARDSGLMNSMG